MIRRKPIASLFMLISLLGIVLAIFVSSYLWIGTFIFFFLRFAVPESPSKCPRCRKDNFLEPWARHYHCQGCKTSLIKEKNGWSRIKGQREAERP